MQVVETRGSTPREVGATMHVGADYIKGSIGGGALEWDAIRTARRMLEEGKVDHVQTFALGPDMGQCCGGAVTLGFTEGCLGIEPSEPPIWIWGAGHVGRAIAAALGPIEHEQITLIDNHADRLPDPMPPHVRPMVATDMPRAVAHAPKDAHHFILTYSHDIDLALCDALLRHGFRSCGLIGSTTKWVRFRKRLRHLGHRDAEISSILCPIGDPSLGKHPQAIAIGVAAKLLGGQMLKESAQPTAPVDHGGT